MTDIHRYTRTDKASLRLISEHGKFFARSNKCFLVTSLCMIKLCFPSKFLEHISIIKKKKRFLVSMSYFYVINVLLHTDFEPKHRPPTPPYFPISYDQDSIKNAQNPLSCGQTQTNNPGQPACNENQPRYGDSQPGYKESSVSNPIPDKLHQIIYRTHQTTGALLRDSTNLIRLRTSLFRLRTSLIRLRTSLIRLQTSLIRLQESCN